MSISKRLKYYQRIIKAYIMASDSHLLFWHGEPRLNDQAGSQNLDQYYMQFFAKANYKGSYDNCGIPMLDYHGEIGIQYNPIAIAQFALGNFNLYKQHRDPSRLSKFINAADWLTNNLENNNMGIPVWMHRFNFEYRDTLKAPWYSGLAQGQGLSVLVRAYQETNENKYLDAARFAYQSFLYPVENGGVIFTDPDGFVWIEEYIVDPPTHVLNGFIWAAWGVYDYYLATGIVDAEELFQDIIETIIANLHVYDTGFWSLYEQSGTKLPMIASPFYHSLHIVQLNVLYNLTNEKKFLEYAERWQKYKDLKFNRIKALLLKLVFKVIYY